MIHKHQRSRAWLLIIVVIVLLGAIFLPGPNGTIAVLTKIYRIKHYQKQLLRQKASADTLENKIKLWQDPQYLTKLFMKIVEKEKPKVQDTLK